VVRAGQSQPEFTAWFIDVFCMNDAMHYSAVEPTPPMHEQTFLGRAVSNAAKVGSAPLQIAASMGAGVVSVGESLVSRGTAAVRGGAAAPERDEPTQGEGTASSGKLTLTPHLNSAASVDLLLSGKVPFKNPL